MFKLSGDNTFVGKLMDIVGLSLKRPDRVGAVGR